MIFVLVLTVQTCQKTLSKVTKSPSKTAQKPVQKPFFGDQNPLFGHLDNLIYRGHRV